MTAKRGRPTKRTPEVEAAVVAALAKGYTRKDAASHAGIGYSTMREWELTYPDFREATQKGEARIKAELVDTIVAAARKQWQAGAWVLERRWPDEFARREHVELSVDLRNEVEKLAAESGLDPDEVMAEAEAVLAGRA